MGLPNQEFRELVRFVNKGKEDKSKKIYEGKEPKGIEWNSYTLSQINEAKEVLSFIKEFVRKAYFFCQL